MFKLLIVVLMGIGGLIIYSETGESSKPDDAQLLNEFKKNKDKYNTLLEMMKQDNLLKHLHLDPHEKGIQISESRIQNYYALMRELKISFIFRHDSSSSGVDISFTRHFHGCDSIGVAYKTNAPESITTTIDIDTRKPYETYYRHVDSNWYLTTHRVCD